MIGNIIYINDNEAHIAIPQGTPIATNMMNLYILFEDDKKKILGEIQDISKDIIKVQFLGEIVDDHFVGGVIRKPTLSAKIRIINNEEMSLIVGKNDVDRFLLGVSPLYDDYPITVGINSFFSNHIAILGNTGSGKSYGVARLVQNVFANPNYLPYKANFFIFDAYGEYHNAFKDISKINPNYNFKIYTTNYSQNFGNYIKIPLWLLDTDDIALLLSATNHSQLPIIERALKIVSVFSQNSEAALKYKNHLIAKAIMNILYTNQTTTSKRNDVFSIVNNCSTPDFNLETPVRGVGYTRKFRDCFMIDSAGNFSESVLMTEYVSSFIDDSLEQDETIKPGYFTLVDLENALNFTLISEGLLNNPKLYNEAVTLKVRAHSLVVGEYAKFFEVGSYMTLENYVASLVSLDNNRKAQIVNFNLEEVDDTFAKFITKVFTKMLFTFTKSLKDRASIPFHIFLEEAHRYVQNDNDKVLFGYNIFERVAKEGRKYGLILNLISQRPVELSETVISQVSNFLIFKLNHPSDVDYVRKILPNISDEIVEKQKTLQPGTCVGFGKAFKVPMIIKMPLPNPTPYSSNCDVFNRWSK